MHAGSNEPCCGPLLSAALHLLRAHGNAAVLDAVCDRHSDLSAALTEMGLPAELSAGEFRRDLSIAAYVRALEQGTDDRLPLASLLFAGPGGVGKSTLRERLVNRRFDTTIKTTDGLHIGTLGARAHTLQAQDSSNVGADRMVHGASACIGAVCTTPRTLL